LAGAFFPAELPDVLLPQQFELQMKKIALFAFAFLSSAATLHAQASRETNCSYQQCALGLSPAWNGLAVTRGATQEQAGVLGFFWPGDVSRPFEADREALTAARDAMAVRQTAAILTDAGVVLAATGLARGLFHQDWDKLSSALTIAGGTAIIASVPIQFAADGYLSRAVWLFNRKFAR
jgi:hypothetical protein